MAERDGRSPEVNEKPPDKPRPKRIKGVPLQAMRAGLRAVKAKVRALAQFKSEAALKALTLGNEIEALDDDLGVMLDKLAIRIGCHPKDIDCETGIVKQQDPAAGYEDVDPSTLPEPDEPEGEGAPLT